MARYSDERKEAVLRRVLPPHNRPPTELAAEEGISGGTLYNRRREARDQRRLLPDGATDPEGWSAADRFAAVVGDRGAERSRAERILSQERSVPGADRCLPQRLRARQRLGAGPCAAEQAELRPQVHELQRGLRHKEKALEPIREDVREHFGRIDVCAAQGPGLRHDNGSQYVANDFQRELTFLGIASSPSLVRAPEGNGCAERIIRTLKEQLLWVQGFADVETLRAALEHWRQLYNTRWLIERHGHRSPAHVRQEWLIATGREAA